MAVELELLQQGALDRCIKLKYVGLDCGNSVFSTPHGSTFCEAYK